MATLRVNDGAGNTSTIDPMLDPTGYRIMLDTRARNRQATQLASSDNPAVQGNPAISQEWGPLTESWRVAAENEPGKTQRMSFSGGSMAPRQSMDALRGGGRSDNLQTIMDVGSYDPRLEQPDFQESWRQTRMRDDAAQQRANVTDAADNANFQLGSGQAAGRAKMQGAIEDEQKMGDARLGSDIYFDPKVKAQRADELYHKMDELRARYSDPAILKGQMGIAEANARGMWGNTREQTRGEGNLAVRELGNEGSQSVADTRARGAVGAAVAGAGGKADAYGAYVPTAGAPGPGQSGGSAAVSAAPQQTMTQAELNAFAAQNGLSVQDALGVAQHHGYKVVQ